MTNRALKTPAANGRGDLIVLLRALARKDAADGVPYACATGIVTLQGGKPVKINAAAWRDAVDQKLIQLGPGLAARLTGSGRTHLRRMLTAPASVATAQITVGIVAPIVLSAHGNASPYRLPKPQFAQQECPIAWLHTRRGRDGKPLISAEQLAAAERLRGDFHLAGMSPCVTSNWSQPVTDGGSAAPDGPQLRTSLAADRVRQALSAVGPEFSSLLIDVCCQFKGLEKIEAGAMWPKRSARIVLAFALTHLARHYGLLDERRDPDRVRIQRWGADGYRPSIKRQEA